MRSGWATTVAVASAVAVAVVAGMDAVRGGREPAGAPTLPDCRVDQLALDVAGRESAPTIRLRHAGGAACVAPLRRIVVEIVPARGHGVGLLQVPGGGWVQCRQCNLDEIGGLFGPGIQVERFIRYQPTCREQGPFEIRVRVGRYFARTKTAVLPCR